MTLAMYCMTGVWKWTADDWFNGWYVLSFQPARVPLYAGYFLLGIIAWRNGWFIAAGFKPRLIPWSMLWVASASLYLGNQLEILHVAGESPAVKEAVYAVLFNAYCLSSLMAGTAFFQRYVNGAGRFWKSLSASSYGIYYIHPLILYPLAYLFIKYPLPLYPKAIAVIALALLISWGTSALVLRKAPGLRRIF